jgi:hypothetical protein
MSRPRMIHSAAALIATVAVLAPVGVAFSDASGPTNGVPGHCRRWVEHDNDPQEHAPLEFLRRCNVTRSVHVTRTRTRTIHLTGSRTKHVTVSTTRTSTGPETTVTAPDSTVTSTSPSTTTTTVTDPNLTETDTVTTVTTTSVTDYTSTTTTTITVVTTTIGGCVAQRPDC